jgi:hypothetical protein
MRATLTADGSDCHAQQLRGPPVQVQGILFNDLISTNCLSCIVLIFRLMSSLVRITTRTSAPAQVLQFFAIA